jgi:hypothetical protein
MRDTAVTLWRYPMNVSKRIARALGIAIPTLVCLIFLSSARPAHAGSGAVVVHFQDQVGFFIVDEAHGLMAFHGTSLTFAQICAGGGLSFEDLDLQLVATPSGPLHLLFTGDDHPVVVYPIAALPDPHHVGPGDCPILSTLQPVASGRARLVRTDNDLTLAGKGANAFGWTCNGTLIDTATGAPKQYSETVRAVQGPGAAFPLEVQTTIRLGF